jgi:hypothetical protein
MLLCCAWLQGAEAWYAERSQYTGSYSSGTGHFTQVRSAGRDGGVERASCVHSHAAGLLLHGPGGMQLPGIAAD